MPHLLWTEAWDCDKVTPLFNVPSCVLWGEKVKAISGRQSFPGEILSGLLPRKNASLSEAQQHLAISPVTFSLHQHGRRTFWAPGKGTITKTASYYKKKFFQGATIVPRTFWFVQVKPSPLGFNPQAPPLATDPRAIKEAKKPYNEVHFSGQVESRFLYATLLSTDLLPFGHFPFRLVVLPIEPQTNKFKLLGATEAQEQGFSSLAKWLEKAEKEWEKLRGFKIESMNIFERLDRYHGLTRQDSRSTYRVAYIKSGTILTATLIDNNPIYFKINGHEIRLSGFLSDYVTYYFETINPSEAHFLAAILNSPEIDRIIKPMQTRGQWGPRDITKKVLELPIPQFEAGNPQHERLVELGELCARKVRDWLAQGGPGQVKSIGRLRQIVRQTLKTELMEIDEIVKRILI